MVRTMIYDGWDIPFPGGTGALRAGHGRFASQAGYGGAAIKVRMIALGGVVPGSSVPSGRRLRT